MFTKENAQKRKRNFDRKNIKSGAMLCPFCYVQYKEVEVDFEVYGTILYNVKIVKCPSCGDHVEKNYSHKNNKKR